MGPELIYISNVTTPAIFFVYILLLFKDMFPNPRAAIALFINSIFMLLFLVNGIIEGDLYLNYLYGGFFLIIFQIPVLFVVWLFGKRFARFIGLNKHAT